MTVLSEASQLSIQMVRIFAFFFLAATTRAAADADASFPSPNKAFVVVATADSHRPDSYAIRTASGARTLATCPDDLRFSATPAVVVWSGDSQMVAIHTRGERHGGSVDIWLVTKDRARPIAATFPEENGKFYLTPKRWLNETDLECEVIGVLYQPPDPANPFKSYMLVMHVNRQARTAKVVKTTKPTFSHPVQLP